MNMALILVMMFIRGTYVRIFDCVLRLIVISSLGYYHRGTDIGAYSNKAGQRGARQ